MFYPRRRTIKAPTRRNFKINAFGGYRSGLAENLIDLSESKFCFNVTARDGELKEGFGSYSAHILGDGVSGYYIPQPDLAVTGAWHYKRYDAEKEARDDRLIVHTIDHRLYSLALDQRATQYELIGENFAQIYTTESYRIGDVDVLLLSTDLGFYVLDGLTLSKVDSAPEIKSLCIHYERAFATVHGEGISLWFSKSLDPTDWSISAQSGGYIEFADKGGKLTKAVSFMGYLYVFREYAIERVSALAEQTEFNVKKVYTSTDKIFHNTIAVCGECIIFLSESGLYYFDGANVGKLGGGINSEEIGLFRSHCVGAYYRGKYFLSCFLSHLSKEDTGFEKITYRHNNCIVVYDLTSGKSEIMMDYDVKGFCVVQTEDTSELFFWLQTALQERIKIASVYENRNVRLGMPAKMYWRTGMTDLGFPEKKKFLRYVTVTSKNAITVGVILDDKRIEKTAVEGTAVKISVNRPFKKLGFYFKCNSASFRIGNPVVTVDMR